jgi:hypothetical protein
MIDKVGRRRHEPRLGLVVGIGPGERTRVRRARYPARSRADGDGEQPARSAPSVVFTVGVRVHHDGQHTRPAHVLQLRLAQQCAV